MSDPQRGFRLSPEQRHLWLLAQQGGCARSRLLVRLAGALDRPALRRALVGVVARHELLRATFHRAPGIVLPIQAIQPEVAPRWEERDLRRRPGDEQEKEIESLWRQEGERTLDITSEPGLAATLVRLGEARHALLLGLPPFCADRASLDLLAAELAAEYAAGEGCASAIREVGVQYLQYSEWHHQLLAGDEGNEGRQRWARLASGAVADRLPWQRRATAAVASSLAEHAFTFPVTHAEVAAFAAQLGASVRAVLLAAWQALLWRHAEAGLGVAAVLDGRKVGELGGTLGPFAQAVPVPAVLAPHLTFAEVVMRAERQLLEAEEWLEFFAIDGDGTVPGLPDFGFELAPEASPRRAGGLEWAPCRQRVDAAAFSLCLVCRPAGPALGAALLYDPEGVPPRGAAGLADQLCELLAGALTAPQTPLARLALQSAVARRKPAAAAGAAPDPQRQRCVHQLFADQAERTPQALAAVFGDQHLSYGELRARVARLARRLQGHGVGSESPVAIFMERSPQALVAIFATLESGGAFLPLDASYLGGRLHQMLEDARPPVVLTQRRLAAALPTGAAACIEVDSESEEPESDDGGSRRHAAPDLDHLAYLLYTSGSTGRPKGVMVAHRGLVNYLDWAVGAYKLGLGDWSVVHSPLSADMTLTSLLAPLLAGGTVELLAETEGLDALNAALASSRRYRVVKITPAHLEVLRYEVGAKGLGGGADLLVLGGDALRGEVLGFWRAALPEGRVVNEYGPTETVVGSSVYELPPGEPAAGPVPLGEPITATQLYLADPALQPLPEGVRGELYIGGEGVARGYASYPAMTAERFVPDPFSGRRGARLYRTGDLARRLPEGGLVYLGRNDFQVKVRGFRVELGEVEAALTAHPDVREAVVVSHEQEPGDRRLAAYLVPASPPGPGVEELRRFLLERLPEFMVPSLLLSLPALPVTRSGKVDRAALPAPGTARPDLEREYAPPRNKVEEVLAEIWAEALGLERVGVEDNFFSLGGDSMRSVRVVALAREEGLDFAVQDLFRYRTIAALAAQIGSADSEAAVRAETDEELSRLLEELEELSEEEVEARLRARLEDAGVGG